MADEFGAFEGVKTGLSGGCLTVFFDNDIINRFKQATAGGRANAGRREPAKIAGRRGFAEAIRPMDAKQRRGRKGKQMDREEMGRIDLPQWELLPDIGLYMDQVVTLMDRTFSPALPKGEMTKSMVNNYVKVGLIPRPVGKKYDREHLAMLLMICVLKQVLPVKDVALLTSREMENKSVQENYDRFCAELSSALNSAADQMPEELDEEHLAETAMSFALLSYAFGLSARRMTEVMRSRESGEQPSRRELRERKKAEKKAEQEKETSGEEA